MDEERIQRTAFRLAVRRGLLDSDVVTAAIKSGNSLSSWVEAGLLDPVNAHRLEAEAALASPVEGEEGETQLLGLFPLKNTERYQPELYLGDGGMGRVFRVYDTLLKRRVALKFFRTSLPAEAKVFQREAASQARIDHPNVARIFEAGELEGFPFLCMQFIQGPTLAAAALDLDLKARVEMVRQACLGIHAAHKLGIVHRDLKPGNIMLEQDETKEWKAFVMDFGLARDLSEPGMLPSTTIMGTPAFMAPEQVMGPAVLVGPHTDVYALGVTLYQLACGQLPFRGDNHALVMRRLVDEEALPLHFLDPAIPRELEAIVQRCMEKDIFRRYDSALDLAEDLGRFLEGEPVKARPHSPWRRWERKLRRNSLATLAAGAFLVVGVGWMFYARRSRSEVEAMQGRITAQGEDLSRTRAELERLREAQMAERARTATLQQQVALARTPVERKEAEEKLKESRAREQALAAKVAEVEQRPVNPPVKVDPPAEAAPATTPVQPRVEPEPAVLVPPQMVRQAPMNYPPRALSNPGNPFRSQDVVVLLQVQVDAQGLVQDVRVESGIAGPWGYNEAAVAAIRASTFSPAQRGGQPVAGSLPVTVRFKKVR